MTGLVLPRLGIGTAAIGNLYAPVPDDAARDAVTTAYRLGVRLFDTAPYYGFGLAERRLGAALRGADDVLISTKVGRVLEPATDPARVRHGFVDADPFDPVFDYSEEGVLRSLQGSLQRLQRPRVDILLAHDLGRETHGAAHEQHLATFLASGYPAMAQLRATGTVRAIGIGVNEVAIALDLAERVDLDVILLAGRYTLLDQSAAAILLPLCEPRGIRVIVGGPYNSGILAAPIEGNERVLFYNYDRAADERVACARRIEAVARAHNLTLPAAALQYPLRHPAVASVIPGVASAAEARDAVERHNMAIPAAFWSDLKAEGLLGEPGRAS